MNQPMQGPNHPPRQALVVRDGTRPTKNQLAQLAASCNSGGVREMLAQVINSGEPQVIQVSATLASNAVLDQVLGGTTTYKYTQYGETPGADFNALSVRSSTEAAAALARLTAGFYEARTLLAKNYDETNEELMEAFETVNASYALIISTSHKLFDSDDPSYRERLRPEFLKLLMTDPYLEKLVPSFRDLHEAKSLQATRIALRTFFENFCENAVEPYVYSKDFSALIQSILLRELRHVVVEESKLPVKERVLAPYLAKLFEQRMRGELETARTKDGKAQPVLDSLRDCPGEAKQLMRSVTNFLIESLGDEGEGLILQHSDLISCEVMLSIGCLLPETELTQLLATRLRQVDDLNPSLVMVFSSALKFSLYVEQSTYRPFSYAMIEPSALVELGFKIANYLTEPEKNRLVAEVFLPLLDDFIHYAYQHLETWREFPDEFRAACVDKLLLQKVIELEQQSVAPDVSVVDTPALELSEILTVHLNGGAKLDPIGLRWLVKRGASGELTQSQISQTIISTLQDGKEAKLLAVEPDIYEELLTKGGFESIKILSSRKGNEERLSHQLAIYQPSSEAQTNEMRKVFVDKLGNPLRIALREYGDLVTARRSSDLASMQAHDNLQDLSETQVKLAHLKQQIIVCRGALEDNADFVRHEKAYGLKLREISDKQIMLAELKGLTTKELVETKKDGISETLIKNIVRLEQERDIMLAQRFQLPKLVKEELPNLGRISMSLGELLRMEKEYDACSRQIGAAQGALSSALGNIQKSLQSMVERRKEIRRLFAFVQRGAESIAIRGIDPQELALFSPSSFDPLGMFCRISLMVQLNADRQIKDDREQRLQLERDVRRCLQASLQDLFSKDDSRLVLTALAELVERGRGILIDWQTGEDSLPEFLRERLANDINNDAVAWLTHDSGWDESMHAPILRIFGAMLSSKVVPREAKLRAMPITFSGVRYWVAEEERIRSIEQENRHPSSKGPKEVPSRYLTTEDLYRPWTSLLQLSLGQAKRQGDSIIKVTEFLLSDAIQEITTADYSRLKEIWLPLRQVLLQCEKSKASVLNPLPQIAVQFCRAVNERVSELKEQSKQREKQIFSEAPQAPVAEGISFADLSVPGGLSLPAPRHQRAISTLLEHHERDEQ